MRRSKSPRPACALPCGVSYFANSCCDACAVISSRVLWDKIVEIRTRNGSSRSATIFARAVSPWRRSPAGRYRLAKSRMMNGIRSRTDAEVVKGLPRRVNRSRDQDDVVGARTPNRRVDRIPDGWNRDALRMQPKHASDLFAIERAVRLRAAGIHARCEGPEGRRHPR